MVFSTFSFQAKAMLGTIAATGPTVAIPVLRTLPLVAQPVLSPWPRQCLRQVLNFVLAICREPDTETGRACNSEQFFLVLKFDTNAWY